MCKIRAKNLYMTKDKPKTSIFYETNDQMIDAKNNSYQVYFRNKPKYYVDIPLGENDVGLIVLGYFILIGSAHPNTLDYVELIKKRTKDVAKTDVLENSISMINTHNKFMNKENNNGTKE